MGTKTPNPQAVYESHTATYTRTHSSSETSFDLRIRDSYRIVLHNSMPDVCWNLLLVVQNYLLHYKEKKNIQVSEEPNYVTRQYFYFNINIDRT